METDFKSFYMFARKQWKSLNTKIKEKLDEVGLTSQHVSYLIALSSNKNIRMKELNDLVGNDPALTTRVLTTLFSKEFVAKTAESKRKCKLYLTKKGEELMNALEKIFQTFNINNTKEEFLAITRPSKN